MESPGQDEEPCEQCGLCCRIFGPGIAPTSANVYTWIEQGRTDILQWFVAYPEQGGGPVSCTSINPKDLGNIVIFEMRNPETGGYVTVCPFLRRVAKDRYLCGIHTIKPEMCCTYQPWVWGETYFNRCRSLHNRPAKKWL